MVYIFSIQLNPELRYNYDYSMLAGTGMFKRVLKLTRNKNISPSTQCSQELLNTILNVSPNGIYLRVFNVTEMIYIFLSIQRNPNLGYNYDYSMLNWYV